MRPGEIFNGVLPRTGRQLGVVASAQPAEATALPYRFSM